MSTSNYAKFIDYVLAYKLGRSLPQDSPDHIHSLESMESCQSLVVDRGLESSSKLKQSKTYNKSVFPIQEPKLADSIISHKFGNSKHSSNAQSKELVRQSRKRPQRKEVLKYSTGSHSTNSQGGYFCDHCQMAPIIGRRFHCMICSDFDLCESCYFHTGHKHEMEAINNRP